MSAPIYTARAHVTGGRAEGRARTDDGRLDVAIEPPEELGGTAPEGTNPEQLFAAGYAACFLSALKLVAQKRGVELGDAAIDSTITLMPDGRGFRLGGTLRVVLPGVGEEQARKLVDTAHQVCPYSNAVRGNVDIALEVDAGGGA
jgi:lipoyl-dependent peroxiredoxin